MKNESLKNIPLRISLGLVLLILVLIPFHAFLTVWASTIFGHYTLVRLWKEYLLVVLLLVSIYFFITDPKLRKQILSRRLFYLILSYLLIQVVWGIVAFAHKDVNAKALFYGLLLNCRFLIFFLIVWLIALKSDRLKKCSYKMVIWPAFIVVIFGLLQILVLPHNFLSHFGYNLNTIPAYETINHNSNYIRIESTLRGANPLGAYILIPISLITVLLVRGKRPWQKLVFLMSSLIVLLFTFSRSAWLGSIVSVAVAGFYSLGSKVLKLKLVYVAICLLIVLLGLGFIFRNNPRVQNIVLHTQSHSTSKTSSDEGHSSALKNGVNDVIHEPLGEGPGSAGPASVYNNHPARIAENYFIQIGQETGWLGLLLFLAINICIGYSLWLSRADSLSLALLASLIGICIVNMLSHAWSDDTLAYLWWGLAGISFAHSSRSKKV